MQTVEIDGLDLSSGDRLLDVGCGEGRHMHAAALEDDVRTVGVDVDRDRIRLAREGFDELDGSIPGRHEMTVSDALRLPFRDGAFDAVVCSEVLEHLPDYERAVAELARVLAPGGRLGVSVPRYWPERLCWLLSDGYHETDGGHVRIFRREQLRSALEEQGLTTVREHSAHALHSPYWWLKCLWWGADPPPAPLAYYERFLEWDVVSAPRVTDLVERALNPVLGKSRVLYLEKEEEP